MLTTIWHAFCVIVSIPLGALAVWGLACSFNPDCGGA